MPKKAVRKTASRGRKTDGWAALRTRASELMRAAYEGDFPALNEAIVLAGYCASGTVNFTAIADRLGITARVLRGLVDAGSEGVPASAQGLAACDQLWQEIEPTLDAELIRLLVLARAGRLEFLDKAVLDAGYSRDDSVDNQQELADFFGVTTRTISRWSADGMPTIRVGAGGVVRYSLSACARWKAGVSPQAYAVPGSQLAAQREMILARTDRESRPTRAARNVSTRGPGGRGVKRSSKKAKR